MYPRYVLLECSFVEEKTWHGVSHTQTQTQTPTMHTHVQELPCIRLLQVQAEEETKGGVPVSMHACSVPLEVYSFLSLLASVGGEISLGAIDTVLARLFLSLFIHCSSIQHLKSASISCGCRTERLGRIASNLGVLLPLISIRLLQVQPHSPVKDVVVFNLFLAREFSKESPEHSVVGHCSVRERLRVPHVVRELARQSRAQLFHRQSSLFLHDQPLFLVCRVRFQALPRELTSQEIYHHIPE